MQELYDIDDYFPLRIADQDLRNYISYHINHLQKCHENELYSSAFTHLHILYMVFIYFQLLRIAKENSREFSFTPLKESGWSGSRKKSFSFCGNPIQHSWISSPVTKRNEWLHATGEIYCETENKFECEVNDYIVRMNKIISSQSSLLSSIYEEILSRFESDYIITDDDIALYFSDFSRFELIDVTQNRNDLIAEFIKEKY